jgi:hypothetical protein
VSLKRAECASCHVHFQWDAAEGLDVPCPNCGAELLIDGHTSLPCGVCGDVQHGDTFIDLCNRILDHLKQHAGQDEGAGTCGVCGCALLSAATAQALNIKHQADMYTKITPFNSRRTWNGKELCLMHSGMLGAIINRPYWIRGHAQQE